jgi:hypothetical protein
LRFVLPEVESFAKNRSEAGLDRPQSQNHEAKQRWIESYLGRSVSRRVDGIIVHGNTAKQILESRWGHKHPIESM